MGSCFGLFEKKRKLRSALKKLSDTDDDYDDDLLAIIQDTCQDPDDIIRLSEDSKGKKKNKCKHFKENHEFLNWGETVHHHYKQILFPNEVDDIQKFVKAVKVKGKSVRGSGVRHSWANIYADPDNYLVSFYPELVATGKFGDLLEYATYIEQNQLDNPLKMKDGLYSIEKISKKGDITLVKLGAGVSNEQLRRWCLRQNLQYQTNTIMVEINFCGALGTCSHGSGIQNPPIPDFIYEIQFINCLGERQVINKKDHPHLIKSAASNMGLLGLTVFVTLEMVEEGNAIFSPRKGKNQDIIPRPGQEKNLKRFQWECKSSYSEWFYFTKQSQTYSNIFNKQPKVEREINPTFPPPVLQKIQGISLGVNNFMSQNGLRFFTYLGMKIPYVFFPGSLNPLKKQIKIDFMDAIHFQRGIQNFQVRDFQVEINVPKIGDQMDYNLIQEAWWQGMDYVQKNSDVVDMALQMRLFKGSQCPLAPQVGMDYVCSIEILRTLPVHEGTKKKWGKAIEDIWNIWSNLKDHTGKKVTIRPHWGKQWDAFDDIKHHLYKDSALIASWKRFLNDYEEIAKLGGWDKDEGLKMFSNQTYSKFIELAKK